MDFLGPKAVVMGAGLTWALKLTTTARIGSRAMSSWGRFITYIFSYSRLQNT